MTTLFRKNTTKLSKRKVGTLSSNKVALLINLSLLGATAALPTLVNASDAIGPGDSDSTWILGATGGAFNNPYVGGDNETGIAPNIRYNGERFFIKDASLNLHITKILGFSSGLTLALDGGFLSDRDNYDDNEKLAGINERDATLLGGIYVNHDTELGRLSFSALSDVGDEHDGRIANLEYTFDMQAGDWNINPVLGVEWLSEKYVDHYFGVSANEATSTRAQYRGESTTNAFAGIRARYDVTENWDLNLRTGVTKLGSGITNSSIVDDDLVYQASIGINYNF